MILSKETEIKLRIGMGNCLSPSTEQLPPISAEESVKVFTMAELKKATKDFGKEMVIEDSFGGVVKGYINLKTLSPSKEGLGMTVAVKRIYLINEQALQEWLVSLEFLLLNSHPSLVKLIGFGVILLEILTGFDRQRIILAKRAIRNGKEKIVDMIDPDLENSYPLEDGMLMCKIIKQCIKEDPKKRPSMQQVLDKLNVIAQI